jgi:hypothetical protein
MKNHTIKASMMMMANTNPMRVARKLSKRNERIERENWIDTLKLHVSVFQPHQL